MAARKHDSIELKRALETSRSIAAALRKAGRVPAGGNYATAHALIRKHNIDTSHMTGQGWNKGNVLGFTGWNTIPLEEILVESSNYTNTHRLKGRLIQAGLKRVACENCGLEKWNGEEIPLELNHVNGDRFDHRLENLQLLCPNCHAQTDNYRGKNKKNGYLAKAKEHSGDGGMLDTPDLKSGARKSVRVGIPLPAPTCSAGVPPESLEPVPPATPLMSHPGCILVP